MKALATGAGGFAGSHLKAHLHAQGVEFQGVDRTLLSDPALFAEELKRAKPDYVFHLAGVSSSEDMREFYRANVLSTATLFEAMTAAGISKSVPVLLVGSGAEYGGVTPDDCPITESTPTRPLGHYGLSKWAQSMLGQFEAGKQGRLVVIARPFNLIGSGMPKHLSLASFAGQLRAIAKSGQPGRLRVGNLEPVRDFMEVEDAVRIFWDLIRRPEARGQTFNVCTGRPVKIREALEALIEIAGIDVKIEVDPARVRAADIPVHYGNPAKLHGILGEIQYTDLKVSLRRLYESIP